MRPSRFSAFALVLSWVSSLCASDSAWVDATLQVPRPEPGVEAPVELNTTVEGALVLDLVVDDGGDGPACDHADWGDAAVVLEGGQRIWLNEIRGTAGFPEPRYPFSFRLGEQRSALIVYRRRKPPDAAR